MTEVAIRTPFIKLDSFLKYCGVAETGGQAKEMIQAGQVAVNKEVCFQRGKKLKAGDEVAVNGTFYKVVSV